MTFLCKYNYFASQDPLKKWALKQKITYNTPAELIALPAVIQKIEQEVAEVNEHFGQWEKVKKITLIAEVMTTENGLLTPTLKVKRKVITAKYQQEINNMYVN